MPLPIPGDLRAFDGGISGFAGSPVSDLMPVEAVTHLTDVQAEHRRIKLKLRGAGIPDCILLLADTRHNRDVLRAAGSVITHDYPLTARSALKMLATGRRPTGSAVIVL